MLSNPEFAREGSAITDQLSPDRVMIGGPSSVEGDASIGVLTTLYSNWVPTLGSGLGLGLALGLGLGLGLGSGSG